MSSITYTSPVLEQPTAAIMDPSGQHTTEKRAHDCCQNRQSCTADDDIQLGRHRSKCHHSSHLGRLIFPGVLALLVLTAGLFALSYFHDGDFSVWGLDEFIPRQISTSGSTTSPFVKRKLYLIILFVGILVVIVLGIALSFWCCKGAFKNPLCCPCYLCACCGGLACLECIGCGLCVEALEGA